MLHLSWLTNTFSLVFHHSQHFVCAWLWSLKVVTQLFTEWTLQCFCFPCCTPPCAFCLTSFVWTNSWGVLPASHSPDQICNSSSPWSSPTVQLHWHLLLRYTRPFKFVTRLIILNMVWTNCHHFTWASYHWNGCSQSFLLTYLNFCSPKKTPLAC